LCIYYNYFLNFVTKLADFFTPKLFPHVTAKAKIHCGVLLMFCKRHLTLTNNAIVQDVRNKYKSILLSDF